MVTLADSLVSSSSRPLAVQMRADLSAREQRYLGRVYWIVKDPIALSYFRFQPQEYAILKMLDGETSVDQIKEKFEEQFPPHKITVEEVGNFIGRLHQSGLVITHVPGQGDQLKERADTKKRKERIAQMSNVLAIRFKGIDPEKFLTWSYPAVRWLFAPLTVGICCFMALCAAALVTVQFDVFQSKLPAFHEFFKAENWIWLILAMGVTKVIHEFGHGFSCKHFGGECHEIGLMILVLTPCLYCNVSDSWMLPSKWRRAAIGAAGMYIELVIASICTFLWWFSEPGMLNQLCLSVMFVSSVSTLMFNANPLLRYDGYYILSDLVEIPNLRQKSSTILNRKMGAWFLGLEEPDDPYLPQRNQLFFAFYTVAAVIYRWVVVLSILWFLYQIFEPYGLQSLGQLIGMAALYGLIVQPLWKLGKFFYVPGRLQKVKLPRMYATLAGVGVLLLAVLFIPLPYAVMCPVEVQPKDAAPVILNTGGRLDRDFKTVKPGQAVAKGDILARFLNEELEIEVEKYRGLKEEHRESLDSLLRERFRNPESAGQIPEMRELLEVAEKIFQQKQEELESLTLRAPISGFFMLPPMHTASPRGPGRLPTWSGFPTDRQNRGMVFQSGQQFGFVGDPAKMQALLVIDEGEIEFVSAGDNVEINFKQLASEKAVETEIQKLVTAPYQSVSRRLSAKYGGPIPTTSSPGGSEKPLSAKYRAIAPLEFETTEKIFRAGLMGEAKIHTHSRTLGSRLGRFISKTFNFDL